MTLDWWTLGLQTINVVILIWLLSRFLFKPVARIIAERQARAGQLLDEAAAARTAAQAEREAAEGVRQALEAQRASALKQAQQEAGEARQRLLQRAEAEAAQLQAQAAQAIEAAQARAQRAAEAHAAALALDIAARLVGRLSPAVQVSGFLDGLIDALQALPDAVRRALADAGEPLVLRAPRALSEAEIATCRERLAELLGGAPALRVDVDPGLIAGLELEGASAQVQNSFRADLARLTRELQRDAR